MRLSLIAIFCLFFMTSWGQEESQGLELFHREKRVTMIIPLGTELVIKKEGVRLKGTLESITAKGIVIDGQTHAIRDITWLGKKTGLTKTLAITMGVVGVGIMSAGVVYLTLASGAGFVSSGLLTAGGGGIALLGHSLFKNGKRHYLDSDWKFVPPT